MGKITPSDLLVHKDCCSSIEEAVESWNEDLGDLADSQMFHDYDHSLLNFTPKKRVAIIWDGHAWFARKIGAIEYDGTNDEMIYYCVKPIVNDAINLSELLTKLRKSEKSKKKDV